MLKTREQLEEEARVVHKLAFESGDKFLPEKEGIRYHVIAMPWVTQWKKYVDYERVCGLATKEESKASTNTPGTTSEGDPDAQLTQNFHHGGASNSSG